MAQPAPAVTGPFTLPPLAYAFDALEPHIDALTMQIHHDKHHAAYVTNLNKAVAEFPELGKKRVEDLVRGLNAVPEKNPRRSSQPGRRPLQPYTLLADNEEGRRRPAYGRASEGD